MENNVALYNIFQKAQGLFFLSFLNQLKDESYIFKTKKLIFWVLGLGFWVGILDLGTLSKSKYQLL